jgi:DNA-binding response OmpR family regulator
MSVAEVHRNPSDDLGHKSSGLRVLLVEDDAADTYLIKCALQNERRIGAVLHAADGLAALALLDGEDFVPDVAIIDLNMPRKDGFALLAELGRRPEISFPKFVLTSSVAQADRIRGRLSGADLVLTKPDTMRELEILLRTAITTV